MNHTLGLWTLLAEVQIFGGGGLIWSPPLIEQFPNQLQPPPPIARLNWKRSHRRIQFTLKCGVELEVESAQRDCHLKWDLATYRSLKREAHSFRPS